MDKFRYHRRIIPTELDLYYGDCLCLGSGACVGVLVNPMATRHQLSSVVHFIMDLQAEIPIEKDNDWDNGGFGSVIVSRVLSTMMEKDYLNGCISKLRHMRVPNGGFRIEMFSEGDPRANIRIRAHGALPCTQKDTVLINYGTDLKCALVRVYSPAIPEDTKIYVAITEECLVRRVFPAIYRNPGVEFCYYDLIKNDYFFQAPSEQPACGMCSFFPTLDSPTDPSIISGQAAYINLQKKKTSKWKSGHAYITGGMSYVLCLCDSYSNILENITKNNLYRSRKISKAELRRTRVDDLIHERSIYYCSSSFVDHFYQVGTIPTTEACGCIYEVFDTEDAFREAMGSANVRGLGLWEYINARLSRGDDWRSSGSSSTSRLYVNLTKTNTLAVDLGEVLHFDSANYGGSDLETLIRSKCMEETLRGIEAVSLDLQSRGKQLENLNLTTLLEENAYRRHLLSFSSDLFKNNEACVNLLLQDTIRVIGALNRFGSYGAIVRSESDLAEEVRSGKVGDDELSELVENARKRVVDGDWNSVTTEMCINAYKAYLEKTYPPEKDEKKK